MEGVVALLLAEDALAVFGRVLVGVVPVLPVQLGEPDCEGKQHEQEEAQKLPKFLQHLPHGDLERTRKTFYSPHSFHNSTYLYSDMCEDFRI